MTAVLAAPTKPRVRRRRAEGSQRLLLYDVDWKTYDRLLRALDGKHLRLTYDQGTLEIMTVSLGHEGDGRFMGRLIVLLTVILGLTLKSGGSTTFRKRLLRRGLEPDDCFWITNEAVMRGKREIDLSKDPPPDLAIEV